MDENNALLETARQTLHEVERLRDAIEALERKHAEQRAPLLKPIKKEWTTLERLQKREMDVLTNELQLAETRVRELTIELGFTVQGETLQCCYMRGRVTWNADRLDGMTVAFPDIATARSVGKPTASLRKLGTSD